MMVTPTELVLQTARPERAVIALSEGSDPRIIEGALMASERGVARCVLIGDRRAVCDAVEASGLKTGDTLTVEDPADSAHTKQLAEIYFELCAKRGVTREDAAKAVLDPVVFSALMVREGLADGTVGGAVRTTSDIVRAAIQMIGKAPDAALVSSFFLMYPPDPASDGARAMLYSDSGLVIDPTADELASIAALSAGSFAALMRDTPRIAMLSFSTKGSASHAAVSKVAEATQHLRHARPDLLVDGELQFDAAFLPSVGQRKAPGSDVAGCANVMIFPNLDAGNIGYKITQRLGGYSAIGPVLQGLNKPANDLSRGCSAEDVAEMIAVTVLQAAAVETP
jgi:phosphate acetyltransferase